MKQTYLAYDGINYKIGTSVNSESRISNCKTANPNIELLAFGYGVSEKELHTQYDEKRVDREWFDLEDVDVNYIITKIKGKKQKEMEISDFKKARLNSGLSQTELANILGVSRGTVVNYENGSVIPETKRLMVEDFIYKNIDNTTNRIKATRNRVKAIDITTEQLVMYIDENFEVLNQNILFRKFIEKITYKNMLDKISKNDI